MATFNWDVLLPGEDIPRSLTTDYILSEGEEITVEGTPWLIEHVEIDESIADATGIVSVIAASRP